MDPDRMRRMLRGHRVRRGLVVAVGVVLLVHGIATGALVALQRADTETVLPGVAVAGTPVGGFDLARLETAVADRSAELLADPVRITVPGAQDLEDLTTDRRDIGMYTEAAAATEEAWELGRRGLWRALTDHVRARAGAQREIRIARGLDLGRLERWATATAAERSEEPRPAEVRLIAVMRPDDTRIDHTPASSGARVPPGLLIEAAEAGYAEPGLLHIEAPREPVGPATSDADLEAAIADGETALSGPVRLRNPSPGADLVLDPADLASILRVEFDPEASDGRRLVLTADPADLLAHLTDRAGGTGAGLGEIDTDPLQARIALADGAATVEDGTPGFALDPLAAADRVRETSLRRSGRTGELPGALTEPIASRDRAQAALDASGLDVSSPVLLENPASGGDLEVTPDQLIELLSVTFHPEIDDGDGLSVHARAERLLELVDEDDLAAIKTAPVEPRFSIVDGVVSITEGEPGVALDVEAAADRIAELVTEPEPRRGELPVTTRDPQRSMQDARELGIEEEVSSFTTSMFAGQERNRNIRQAADYLDGSLVLPGSRLSLNDAIGRRTIARGFGEGGFIRDGEIVTVVGGGVSQMATTFMNAAWFAGVELVEFKPHSLYFSRYPVGRESTMSGNTLDVVFENDSPYGILVTTDHSDTHLTVSFWSTPWAEVDTWTGEPRNRVTGPVRDGFDVSFGRTITYPDGESRDESYWHRYRPE